MLEHGAVFAGYTVERLLGRGGMGAVYLARHPRLPRWTALKLLDREMFYNAEIRARFEREAELVARLDHPNIVGVYDRGVQGEQLWISMRYIDGSDAASIDRAAMPPWRAVRIVGETAKALDFAHARGVLHRDVKPANILLEPGEAGADERVYLSDFGIARPQEDSAALTRTGTFTATLAFASPEQLSGARLDHRSDQYSLACSLFRLVTGGLPFPADNPVGIISGHLHDPPPSASGRHSDVPVALDGVLARAMAKQPRDRFDSCAEFAEAARRALTAPSQAHAVLPAPHSPVLDRQGGSATRVPPAPAARMPFADPGSLPSAARYSETLPMGPGHSETLAGAYIPPGSPPSRPPAGVIMAVAAAVSVLLVVIVLVLTRDQSTPSPPSPQTSIPQSGPAAVTAPPSVVPSSGVAPTDGPGNGDKGKDKGKDKDKDK
ncbi:serine/threonine protein kinase [Nocardia higoensis]|uniref:non-specific serine/threonine protein kinase n=1 Tax=Nocardia higoensis TaxID=228599 RepID=A0ABS0DEV1_9NOCA|nr:serine/threonine protein kinase [Nocardia higoensis]